MMFAAVALLTARLMAHGSGILQTTTTCQLIS